MSNPKQPAPLAPQLDLAARRVGAKEGHVVLHKAEPYVNSQGERATLPAVVVPVDVLLPGQAVVMAPAQRYEGLKGDKSVLPEVRISSETMRLMMLDTRGLGAKPDRDGGPD